MYPLRLQHPQHGYHYVYSPQDEEAHRAIGWGDEDAAAIAAQAFAAPQDKPDPHPSAASPDPVGAAPAKKRGRPRKAS